MSDLENLFSTQDKVDIAKAQCEAASRALEIAQMKRNIALLISQHEPVSSLGLDRERLRIALNYIQHGDLSRLERELKEEMIIGD